LPEEGADSDRHDDEDWVPEDDAVIGRAFRISLLVAVVVAAVVALVWLWPGSKGDVVEHVIDTEAPEVVTRHVEPPQVRFVDATEEAGIDFVHVNGAYGAKLLPESMGSGVAILDFDGDGDQDLLFVNSTSWPDGPTEERKGALALYANDGRGNFTDISKATGIDLSLYGTGIAVGDYDGDGDPDIFVSAVGTNLLLRNEGGASFVDVTLSAGVGGDSGEWSSSSAFLDYDNDGDLDLVVGNYVRWSQEIDLTLDYRLTGIGRAYGPPVNYAGTNLYLYRNDGGGSFTDVSKESGIEVFSKATGEPIAKSLGLAPVDVDADGDIDLFVANDTVRNFLFINQADGTFEEAGEIQGIAYGRQGKATGAMGVDAAFLRNDSDLAFLVANFANEMSSLYVSQGDTALYTDASIVEGLGAPSRRMLSFSVFFFDYDLDGRLDLLQANGHLEDEIATVDPSQSYRQATQLFWNAGDEGLIHVEPASTGDLSLELVGRGSAFADLDGDGDLDVVITQTGDRAVFFRNEQTTGHHYLRVKLVGNGSTSNRDAIGAWIEVETSAAVQRRLVMPTRGYQSQVELVVTFGLGTEDRIERLAVEWPDGSRSVHAVEGVDRVVTIRQEEANPQ